MRGGPAPGRAHPQQPPPLPQPRPGAHRRAGRHRLDVDYEAGQRILIPVKNGEGRYVAADQDLDRLEGEGRVAFRYVDGNPNGSSRDIAGVTSENGRVVGLMPHPEHAVEDLTGPGTDGPASSPAS